MISLMLGRFHLWFQTLQWTEYKCGELEELKHEYLVSNYDDDDDHVHQSYLHHQYQPTAWSALNQTPGCEQASPWQVCVQWSFGRSWQTFHSSSRAPELDCHGSQSPELMRMLTLRWSQLILSCWCWWMWIRRNQTGSGVRNRTGQDWRCRCCSDSQFFLFLDSHWSRCLSWSRWKSWRGWKTLVMSRENIANLRLNLVLDDHDQTFVEWISSPFKEVQLVLTVMQNMGEIIFILARSNYKHIQYSSWDLFKALYIWPKAQANSPWSFENQSFGVIFDKSKGFIPNRFIKSVASFISLRPENRINIQG